MVKAITAEDVTMSQEVDAELVPHVLLGVPLLVGQDVLRLVGVRALHVRRPHLYTQLTVSPRPPSHTRMCVCASARARACVCVRARVRVCVRACVRA